MRKYKKLKNSTTDASVPENHTRISVVSHEKERGNSYSWNGVRVTYCSIGVCDSSYKPCESMFGSCPYVVNKKIEQPRKNTKAYDKYLKERNMLIEQSMLYDYWDERIERIINGESSEEERQAVVVSLSHKMHDWELNSRKDKSTLIRDAYYIRERRKKEKQAVKTKEKEENKQVLFSIGDYFYIKIPHMPYKVEVKDSTKTWHKINTSDGWILKENFTKEFYQKIQYQERHWLREEYAKNMRLLAQQLEENYGMITMFNLLEE